MTNPMGSADGARDDRAAQLAPPLTIADGEVDEVVDIVARALDEVLVGATGAATSVG